MHPTTYPQVNELLDDLMVQLQAVLGNRLVGVYLYGSLVTGDFDLAISDIDVLVAVETDVNDLEFTALSAMQNAFVARHKAWLDRLEIAYLSRRALQMFKTESSQIAITSPGEPFHFKQAGRDYLMNWYFVRAQGRTLFGPPADEVIAPVSREEFVSAVREHVADWREWMYLAQHRGFQAYAILTMCRALYTVRNGEQTSKRQAAEWAAQQLPQWAALIHNAVAWRETSREEGVDHQATLSETRRFVGYVIDLILGCA